MFPGLFFCFFHGVQMAEAYSTQLDRVQTAIREIEENGATTSYSIAGRSATTADLETLYSRESRLLALVARENRGGGARVRRCVPQG